MSRFRITLTSGNDVFEVDEKDTEKLEDFSITIRREDENTNELAYSFSSEISLYGDAYNFVKQEMINTGFRNSIMKIDIYDTCCLDSDTPIFKGRITQDALEWCYGEYGEGCNVNINSIEHNEETQGYDCIASTIISNDTYWYVPGNPNPITSFWAYQHPFIRYCIEARPAFLSHVTMLTVGGIGLIMDILLAIALLIVQIFSIILFIFTAGQVDLSGPVQEIVDLMANIGEMLVGCGSGQISPYVRDYIKNVCQYCGQQLGQPIDFKSSILNDPDGDYYNLVMFYAPVYKGSHEYDNKHRRDYWSNNRPLDTGKQFLDKLTKVFNAKWWFDGTTIHFEPENTSNIPVWFDFTDMPAGKLEKLCFSYSDDDLFLYGRYKYQTDSIDLCGNEAKEWYNDIASYVSPNLPNGVRKGEDLKQLDFAPVRFRNDGFEDNLEIWTQFPFIILLGPAVSVLNAILSYRDVLLLSTGQTFLPKLILIDPMTWKPKRIPHNQINFHSNPIGSGAYYYNTLMWFGERYEDKNGSILNTFNDIIPYTLTSLYQLINKPLKVPNLYTNFFEKDNPKKIDPNGTGSSKLGIEYTADIIYDCDDIQNLSKKPYANVITPYGKGNVKEITVKENVMTVRGKIVGV